MPRPSIVFDEDKHKYLVDGEVYPSVTTIINGTVPKPLTWWGMQVGVANVCILAKRGRLPHPLDPDKMIEAMKKEKITVNDWYWTRADSGKLIHQAFEDYGKTEKIPDLDDFAPVDHMRIQNLASWILENRPEFLEQEVRTASLEYGYAGTFDARIKFHAGNYKSKTCLVDLKTSKHVYPESHFPQLEAYEQAEVESGVAPSDARLILHLPASESASLHPSLDTFDDFLVLLDHWKRNKLRQERMKEWRKEQKRAAKSAEAS